MHPACSVVSVRKDGSASLRTSFISAFMTRVSSNFHRVIVRRASAIVVGEVHKVLPVQLFAIELTVRGGG